MIELTDWLRAELIRRADREAPLEACGLISRARPTSRYPAGQIFLWEAENAAEQPETSFLIAPQDQFDLLEQIEIAHQELAGIYHSHPRSPAAMSRRDLAIAALWPGVTWVIVGSKPCACMEGEPDRTPGCDDCNGAGVVPDFWVGEP